MLLSFNLKFLLTLGTQAATRTEDKNNEQKIIKNQSTNKMNISNLQQAMHLYTEQDSIQNWVQSATECSTP